MRILFLEDDGLTRLAPYLRALGHEPVVLRTGAYDSWHADETRGSDIEVRHLDPDASSLQLIEAASALSPDALISLALLDPHCYRDAIVGDYFRERGLPVVANSPSTVMLANDKLHTKDLLRRNGIAVTEACWVQNADEAAAAADRVGYPVVLKRNDGYSGMGMRLCEDVSQLRRFYQRDPAPMLLEAFVDGVELSVDVLRWHGHSRALSVIYKGATDRDLRRHPIYRLRVAPYPLPASLSAQIEAIAVRAMDLLGIVGVAECEMIYHRERGPLVLEVNPRLAGTTALSAAATGIDPHLQLVHMALGQCDLDALTGERHTAIQIPIRTPLTPGLRARLQAQPQVRRIKDIHWAPHLGITASLTIAERDPMRLLAFVGDLATYVDVKPALSELAQLFEIPISTREVVHAD